MRRYKKTPPKTKHRGKSARTLMREAVYYKFLSERGEVRCFVCGAPVDKAGATLEHVIPLSKGGGDGWGNLAISHSKCNHAKADLIPAKLVKKESDK